ncbi:hypothetical protein ACSBR2_025075 [Camellia fascicularis]
MVHCFHLAGFPKGLISCITGKGSEISDFLTMHPEMELGGKDAYIVLEDADLDLVATNIIEGGFSYSGQRCTAMKVVLVMESVADALVEKVKAKVAKLMVGPPEDNCDITPVVTESSANFIEGLVMDAKQKGATFWQEYKREGDLIWPLLLDHVGPDMRSLLDRFCQLLESAPLKKESISAMQAILPCRCEQCSYVLSF